MKTNRNLIQICPLCAALLLALSSEATTFVVTNTVDGGTGSLRQFVQSAAPGDIITFATNLPGTTLTLFGQLPLNTSVTIDASALPGGVQIGGQGFSRLLYVAVSATVVLTALTLTNGNGRFDNQGGGGIYNAGNLTVNQCTLTGNNANYLNSFTAGGGGIFSSGTLTLNQCTLSGNHSDNNSGGGGGAIYNSGTLNVNQCTLATNSTDFGSGGGGGIFTSYTGTLNIYNSIVAGNSAIGGSGADIVSFSSIAFTGANIVEDFSGNFSGDYPINADPRLEPLGSYGGPTPTMPPLPFPFISPALNACVNGAGFPTDQRGVPRLLGGIADIGSVKLAPPVVATLPAMAAVSGNATLNGTVNPNTLVATAWFQWGTSTAYGNQTTPAAVGGGNTALVFSKNLTGLTPGIVYHCRVVATNVDGMAFGSDVPFPPPPLGIGAYGSQPTVYFSTASGTNFVLQMTTNLTSPNWVTVTNGVPVSGLQISNAPANAVFRLY